MNPTEPRFHLQGEVCARILVVDDERVVRDYIRRCLVGEPFACDTAGSPDEAWEMLLDAPYSLVVCDIDMGRVSGIDLLQRIREHFGDEVAVVMVTGIDDRATAIRTLDLGAYAYLTKPVDPNEVVIHVVNALERRRLKLESNRFQTRLQEEVRDAQAELGWRLLAAVGLRDHETGDHIYRVGQSSRAIAARLDWDAPRLAHLELAAAMHDIGKIGVPDAILLKEGSLTEAELENIRRHTLIGAGILSGSGFALLQTAECIALTHHEHWNGDGYPHGLSGEDIPVEGRITAVADAFDSLTNDRPYRKAASHDEAIEEIVRCRGAHFAPDVADAICRLYRRGILSEIEERTERRQAEQARPLPSDEHRADAAADAELEEAMKVWAAFS